MDSAWHLPDCAVATAAISGPLPPQAVEGRDPSPPPRLITSKEAAKQKGLVAQKRHEAIQTDKK
jgi:hypothetical protein